MPEAVNSPTFTNEAISLFRDCPRCFFLAHVYNVFRPTAEIALRHRDTIAEKNEQKLSEEMQRVLLAGPPLQNEHCNFCNYRQLVRETGIENDLSG